MEGTVIQLRLSERQLMEDEARSHAPREACGFLAGREGRIEWVIPVTNIAETADRYRMEPQAQVRALHAIEDRGLDLLGVYHSHPRGPDRPSSLDRLEAEYPDTVHLIWSQHDGAWSCRAFRFETKGTAEVRIEVTSG